MSRRRRLLIPLAGDDRTGRRTRSRWLRSSPTPSYWIETVSLVAAILVPFFLADYLASLAAAIL